MTRGFMGGVLLLVLVALASDARAWGPRGHVLVTRGAVSAAGELPPWFRDAQRALVELSIAADRWKELEDEVPALRALAPDHYFDLDIWGAPPLPADRWGYVREAERRRLEPSQIGFLPFALLEQYGMLVSAFREARGGRPGAREQSLTAAGMIAHLAGDAVVPLHATKHHDGWVGDNPRGFRRARGIHRWFESELVEHDDAAWLGVPPGSVGASADVRKDVVATIEASLALVPRLYEAELRSHRSRDDSAARALVRERAAAGAVLVAAIWQAAWREAQPPPSRPHDR
jgi:hypothetical protein